MDWLGMREVGFERVVIGQSRVLCRLNALSFGHSKIIDVGTALQAWQVLVVQCYCMGP